MTGEQGQSSKRAKSPPFWTGGVMAWHACCTCSLVWSWAASRGPPVMLVSVCGVTCCVFQLSWTLYSVLHHYSVLVILTGKLQLHFCPAVGVFLRWKQIPVAEWMHSWRECMRKKTLQEKKPQGNHSEEFSRSFCRPQQAPLKVWKHGTQDGSH